MKTSDISNKITADIKHYLYTQGVFCWRQNTQGVLQGGVMRSATKKGVSDLLAACPPLGRLLGIEVKNGADRMRVEQVGFKENLEHVGALFIEAHSLEDFIEKYKALKI